MLRSRSSSGGNLAKLNHQNERGRIHKAGCKAFCVTLLLICGGSILGATTCTLQALQGPTRELDVSLNFR